MTGDGEGHRVFQMGWCGPSAGDVSAVGQVEPSCRSGTMVSMSVRTAGGTVGSSNVSTQYGL
jgi:hypothetical protein